MKKMDAKELIAFLQEKGLDDLSIKDLFEQALALVGNTAEDEAVDVHNEKKEEEKAKELLNF